MLKKIALGCVLPLVVVGLASWYGMRWMSRAAPKAPRYETAAVGTVEIKVTETGTIEPLKKVEVKSKVAGRLEKLLVKEGTQVHAGDLLVMIDPTEIDSQVAQMRAQLAGARARYLQSKRGVLYQSEQTTSGVEQAEQNLQAAQIRLRIAQEQSRTQPELSQSEVDQAKASLQGAVDALDLLRNATHPQAVVQAQSGYDDAVAGADNARRNYERQKSLRAKGFVSDQVVDSAQTEMVASKARLDQAKRRLELVNEQNRLEVAAAQNRVAEARAGLARAESNRVNVGVKEQDAKSAAAAVAQAKAQLAAARASTQQDRMRSDDVEQARTAVVQIENQLREIEVRQHDTRLVAPMDGIVTRRYVEEGELITSGVSTFSSGTPVLQIADLSRMLVKMTVNEVDVYKLKAGLPVEANVDGARGQVFMGHVRQVAPAAGAAPGEAGGAVIRFAVEVEFDKPDPRLRPGMSARCTIVIARRTNVLRVPKQCVTRQDGKAYVQVVTSIRKDGKPTEKVEPRAVVVGLEGDTQSEIVSGLRAGERLKAGAFAGPKRRGINLEFGGGEENRQ